MFAMASDEGDFGESNGRLSAGVDGERDDEDVVDDEDDGVVGLLLFSSLLW